MSASGPKKDPLYGEPSRQDPLYGEGGETPDVSDPETAVEEGKEHAAESGRAAEDAEGGGGQEGI